MDWVLRSRVGLVGIAIRPGGGSVALGADCYPRSVRRVALVELKYLVALKRMGKPGATKVAEMDCNVGASLWFLPVRDCSLVDGSGAGSYCCRSLFAQFFVLSGESCELSYVSLSPMNIVQVRYFTRRP